MNVMMINECICMAVARNDIMAHMDRLGITGSTFSVGIGTLRSYAIHAAHHVSGISLVLGRRSRM